MLFDISITNTLVMAMTNPNLKSSTQNIKKFSATLGHQLLEGYCSRKTKGRRPSVPSKRFTEEHYPLLGPDGKQHRCHLWYLNGIRKHTKWYCKDCDLYLCHKGYDREYFLICHRNYRKLGSIHVWEIFAPSLNSEK